VTVVVYGATGYTGRLAAAELARRGLAPLLAGRNAEKLARVSEEVAQGAPFRIAAADDRPALRRLLADAEVVINCAGPFTLAGDALVGSAVVTGTHYADSTGEQSYMKMVFERHGDEAERRGVALVPGMGFDYAPGDCLARLVSRQTEPLEELTMAYALAGFGMSRGTMRSALQMLGGGDTVYRDGAWRPAPSGVNRGNFVFPAPIGRQAVSRYPAGEVITVPRHTQTRNVRAVLTTATAAPHPLLTPLLPFVMPGVALGLRTPLRPVLNRAIGRLPEGPAEAERRAARFTIVAQAAGLDGSVSSGVLRGTDVYGITAVLLGYAAQLMGEPSYAAAGALGPAAAFDPAALLDAMKEHGLTYELSQGTG